MVDGRPVVSAVTISYNSSPYLAACVRSVVVDFVSTNVAGEILIVENGSANGSSEILAGLETEFPSVVRALYLDRNTGTTYS